MTLRQLENRLDGDRMLRFVYKHASRRLDRDVVAIARRWSSGTWSTAELRAIGHPYRRPGPNPLDPRMINTQRGMFRDSWHIEIGAPGGRFVMAVVNNSDVADFMFGTRRMIARPVWEPVENEMRPLCEQAIMQAVEAYWR